MSGRPTGPLAWPQSYLQTDQALGVRLRDFQKAALEDWVQEYRGDLGTALTDVVGMDAFLADFDLYFAKLSDSPGKTLCEDETFLAYLRQVFGVGQSV